MKNSRLTTDIWAKLIKKKKRFKAACHKDMREYILYAGLGTYFCVCMLLPVCAHACVSLFLQHRSSLSNFWTSANVMCFSQKHQVTKLYWFHHDFVFFSFSLSKKSSAGFVPSKMCDIKKKPSNLKTR